MMCGGSLGDRLARTVPAAIHPADRPMTSTMQHAPSSVAMLATSAPISITVVALYFTTDPYPGQWSVWGKSLSIVLGTPMTRSS
jgi:hypothetical protein